MNRKSESSGRRRSRSLVGFASKGLCETISKSLDSNDRLLMLIELSFQYAMSTVQKEILPNDVDISIFRQKANETWERIKSVIEEKNLVQLAVAENGIPSNSFSNENLEVYHKTINVLETESDKWRELLSNYRESLKRKIDSPYTVDASIWKDKEQLYDYSDVIQSTSSTQDEVSKQIACLKKFKTTYSECLQYKKNVNRALLKRCQNYFKQNVSDSPRTVMKRMMASKRNTPTYSYVKQKKKEISQKNQNVCDNLNVNIQVEKMAIENPACH